ncbi:hypothetical protein ACH5RR_036244 [Cinchona calisaya]|uniref:Uncharacterized protein n=1 Tax=Cinchona calisaya TaxID=153742 RepID=A0ABD2Y6J7_9GENT
MDNSGSNNQKEKEEEFRTEEYKYNKEEVVDEAFAHVLQLFRGIMTASKKTRDRMIEEDIAFTKFIFTKLDNFLRSVLVLLNTKKLQAKLFIEKVGEILRILEMERTTTLPEQEIERILSLALPIERVPVQSWLGNLRASNRKYIWTIDDPWMVLGEVPEIVQQISFITETHLERFLDDTDFYNKREDFRNNLGLLPTREAVRSLLWSSQVLKEALNFLHEVVTETTVFYQRLGFLLTLLEDSEFSNECRGDQELMKFIKGVLDEVFRAVCRSRNRSFTTEKEAKLAFEGRIGMRVVLLETLGKLHSFYGSLDMICDKLGKENFQTWSASRGSILRSSPRTSIRDIFLLFRVEVI